MSKQVFEQRVAEIEALRHASDIAMAEAQLRKALADRNNYIVAKAADVAGALRILSLEPDLVAAFDRHMADPAKSDHLCWAKNAIAKALKNLEHRDPAIFLRGLAHFQNELFWNEWRDSAVVLRSTCALALVACDMDAVAVFAHLTDAMADPETPVRIDAVRAVGQMVRPEGALLLRLKIHLGDTEPAVLGQCFASLLGLGRREAVEFVVRFLNDPSRAIRTEAACAMAESASPEALAAVREHWPSWNHSDMKRAVMVSLGASPLPESAEFLLEIIVQSRSEIAQDAVTALASSRYRNAMSERARAIIAKRSSPQLRAAFEEAFGAKLN